jgi:hypothetical protein
MSIILLTVLVLFVGVVTYMLLKRLVRPVRVVGACVLMVSLAAFIIQIPIFSDKRARNVPNPTDDPGPVGYPTFQKISEEDHNFLDEILQKLNQDGRQQVEPAPAPVQSISKARIVGSGNEPNLKAELVINNTDVKLSEQVTHNETVKRAQLVMHNETVKRAELVRPRQQ